MPSYRKHETKHKLPQRWETRQVLPSQLEVCEDEQVILNVDAKTWPQPSIQWQVSTDNGCTWKDLRGKNQPWLIFTAQRNQNGNLYRALVQTKCECWVTNSTKLLVNYIDGPSNQQVCPGGTATFAIDGRPVPTNIQWQFSSDGTTWTNIPGATSLILNVTNVQPANVGFYRATFSHPCGSVSQPAQLSLKPILNYSYLTSRDQGGPVFNWQDISVTGTTIWDDSVVYDDENSGPFPLGFNFPFFQNVFNSIRVCTNGFASFTSTSDDYVNTGLPSNVAPENLLAIWWDDLIIRTGEGGYVKYFADGSKFIIQYFMSEINDGILPSYQFQVILYPNGQILYQYKKLGAIVYSSTIGLQNQAQDVGVQVLYNGTGFTPTDGTAILFTPQCSAAQPTVLALPALFSLAAPVVDPNQALLQKFENKLAQIEALILTETDPIAKANLERKKADLLTLIAELT